MDWTVQDKLYINVKLLVYHINKINKIVCILKFWGTKKTMSSASFRKDNWEHMEHIADEVTKIAFYGAWFLRLFTRHSTVWIQPYNTKLK